MRLKLYGGEVYGEGGGHMGWVASRKVARS